MKGMINSLAVACCFIMATCLIAATDNVSNQTINTVALVKQADSKEHVELIGVLVKKGNDYYLKDSTGEVKLDIPAGRNIKIPSEGAQVKLTGKIKTNILRAISKKINPVVRVRNIETLETQVQTQTNTTKTNEKGEIMMKKTFLTILTTALSLITYTSFADLITPHAQTAAPAITITKVADALKLDDDSHIWLEGNIIKKTSKDDYIFKDSTGEIKVEICKKAWNNINVTPDQSVRIYGEVDKSKLRYLGFSPNTEIEVKKVETVPPSSTTDKAK